MIRRRVVARGRVQGVFFRETTRRAAEEQGVAGWVRNRADGAVEAVLEGEKAAVEQVLAVMRSGPPAAVVEHVEACEEEPRGERGFRVG